MSTANMNLPTDFRGLTRLFKKYGVNLTRGGLTDSYPNCCVLSALAVINGVRYSNLATDDDKKLDSIEIGFEGWPLAGYRESEYIVKYVKIGRKLYEWSRASQDEK